MSAPLWNPSPSPFFQSDGQFASGAKAFFYSAGTTTPITVYQNSALTIPHSFPVVASNLGVFPAIFLPFGDYRVRIVDQNAALIYDADGISNPAPPASGSGIVVTSDMVLQTGDPIWRPRTGIMAGFVRMNGNTIGSATSGANELANANTQNLFVFLWNTYSNVLCPVSSGRGASAAADFTANKTIGILSMKGLGIAGLDDMGGTAAGRLQAITTCTTNGTTTVVVVSAAEIAVGDSAIVNGISLGPIVSINGTTVVLTSVAAGSASGISFRSSRFADATVAANSAGTQNVKLTIDQMPAHNHTITDPGHTHSYNSPGGPAGAGGFAVSTGIVGAITGNSTTGITINNTGGGNPISQLQPTILGTFYMKL